MILVSIIDLKKKVHSYTHLEVDRSYIAVTSEKIYFIKTSGTKNVQKYWL